MLNKTFWAIFKHCVIKFKSKQNIVAQPADVSYFYAVMQYFAKCHNIAYLKSQLFWLFLCTPVRSLFGVPWDKTFLDVFHICTFLSLWRWIQFWQIKLDYCTNITTYAQKQIWIKNGSRGLNKLYFHVNHLSNFEKCCNTNFSEKRSFLVVFFVVITTFSC